MDRIDQILHLTRRCECHSLTETIIIFTKYDIIYSDNPIDLLQLQEEIIPRRKISIIKKSIYNSKTLKCFLLYLDERLEPDGFNIHKHISEQFPDQDSIFHITKEQEENILRVNKKITSNFFIPDVSKDPSYSNLTRVNQLPKNYTIREEYIRCGKEKTNKCKSLSHGPYYYAYWREDSVGSHNNNLRKKYLGTIDSRL